MDFGQDLEAAVEYQPRCGKSRAYAPHHSSEPLHLFRAVLVGVRDQVEGVERVEKKAAIAGLPERRDDAISEKARPLRVRLVDDVAAPGLVRGLHRALRQVLGVGTVEFDLSHRKICKGL